MVCQTATNSGFNTYHIQLFRELQKRGRNTRDTRKTSWQDLTLFIQEYQRKQYEIILGMDANANIKDSKNLVTNLCQECNLCDVIEVFNPPHANQGTYSRGT